MLNCVMVRKDHIGKTYCVTVWMGICRQYLTNTPIFVIDDNGLRYTAEDIRAQRLCELMEAAIKTTTASYNVDTYPKFRYRVKEARLAAGVVRNQDSLGCEPAMQLGFTT